MTPLLWALAVVYGVGGFFWFLLWTTRAFEGEGATHRQKAKGKPVRVVNSGVAVGCAGNVYWYGVSRVFTPNSDCVQGLTPANDNLPKRVGAVTGR